MMRRRLLTVATMGLALVLTLSAAPTATATTAPTTTGSGTAREPVILVHGFLATSINMAVMKRSFEDAGYPAYTLDLPGANNIENAHAIARLVDHLRTTTGASKVSLVSHSMGGLSTRYYLKRLGGTAHVRSYVAFGTPQYGFAPACLLLLDDLGKQMCPSSGFLADLNAGDDTPGDVAYTTMRSSLDSPDTYLLDGGACFHEIPGVVHDLEPASGAFFEAALSAVEGRCPGTFVTLPPR
ncbi:esterase/lipase family protein [Actinopolymorpha alba]|uniref:esterase/lipase family protein n=1 Tax=Actinopolymorpha alba TaxID=533267 RepID=UPI0003671203|nr:alpha/beta fold hydrolase [Actinopolymorpha alba]